MRTPHPAGRRGFSSPLRAALLALLGGIALEACGPGRSDGAAKTAAAALETTGGDPCNGVTLDATDPDHSGRSADGHVSLAAGSLTFTVPTLLPVTQGLADHGRTELTFALHPARPTTCVYVGDGASAFVFQECRHGHFRRTDRADGEEDRDDDGRTEPLPVAGSTAVADEFERHGKVSGKHAGATTVRLPLPGPAIDDGDECTADSCEAIAGVSHAPIDSSFCRGKANFHDRALAGLGGNGRSCADCHMASERFQLTPAAATARFVRMTSSGVDDPLFRAIDADDFRSNGAAAHDFTNLTENGLVRVSIPLPPNVKLLDCGATVPCPASALPTNETFADVWRSVPSIFDVKITGPDGISPGWPRGPNQNGGYQLDGRFDTLQTQALAALQAHARTTLDPPARFLDDLATFQNTQFSSPRVKSLSDAITAGTNPPPDPDPVLNALEVTGKAVFIRACGQCHGNTAGHPSGSTPIAQGTVGTPTELVRYHDISSACPRPVDTATPPRYVFAARTASQMEN